jgi:hypothetical protein
VKHVLTITLIAYAVWQILRAGERWDEGQHGSAVVTVLLSIAIVVGALIGELA